MTSGVPSRSTKLLLDENTTLYQSQLHGSPGESHLLERGLTPEVIQKFRLGYVRDPVFGDEQYKGRITIPYLTVSGVVSMRYRSVTDDKPKYLSRHGEVGRPFNVMALRNEGPIFVTEGEIDAISLDMCGVASVGFPGSQSWRPIFGRLFRYRRVCVCSDGDDAGIKFAELVARDLDGAVVIGMPPGEDVNSCLQHHGINWVREWLGIDE